MSHVHTQRAEQKPPVPKDTPEKHEPTKKDGLRGKSFAEQDKLLNPFEDEKAPAKDAAAPKPDAKQKGKAAAKRAYPPDVQAVLDRWPNGIAMSFYTDYIVEEKARGEFIARATEQAGNLGAVRLEGGKLVLGKANPIQGEAAIVSQTNEVVAYLQKFLSPEDLAADKHKLAQLHIYGHGWGSGLGTGGGHGGDKDKDKDKKKKKDHKNMSTNTLDKFVAAIGASLRGDVNVALMACSTGKDVKGGSDGEGSFADALRDELARTGHEDANVSGHTTKGHTTGNPLGRLFTGKDDAGAGGVTFFDAIFPKAWREKEVANLDAKKPLTEPQFAGKLKGWFIKYTKLWRSGKTGDGKNAKHLAKGQKEFDMGYLMMVDFAQAKEIYRAAWDQAEGSFNNLSYVPTVDWSKVGVRGADSAREAQQKARDKSQLIDL